MKSVAGSIKLELAQYREMEAFSQFASDLDPTTQKLLARGARLTELLKQKQYAPMPMEEQVVSVFAGVKGHLDKLAVERIAAFEEAMVQRMRNTQAGILKEIRQSGKLSDENATKLNAALERFVKEFEKTP